MGVLNAQDDYTKNRNYWKYLKNKLKNEGSEVVSVTNQLTGFLLFLTVPTISWCIILIAIVALIATFAAIQEGYIIHSHSSSTTPRWTELTPLHS